MAFETANFFYHVFQSGWLIKVDESLWRLIIGVGNINPHKLSSTFINLDITAP